MCFGYIDKNRIHNDLKTHESILQREGCEKIYISIAFSELITLIPSKSTLIVLRLSCLGGDLSEILNNLKLFFQKNIVVKCSYDKIQFPFSSRNNIITFFSFIDSIELSLSNLESYKKRRIGKLGGRPKGLNKKSKSKLAKVIELYTLQRSNGDYIYSISQIEQKLNVSRPTIYRYLKRSNIALRN